MGFNPFKKPPWKKGGIFNPRGKGPNPVHYVREIKNKAEDVKDEVEDQVSDIAEEVKDEIEKIIKSAVGQAFGSALSFAAKELKNNAGILKSFSITIDFSLFSKMLGGGVTLSWGNVGKDFVTLAEKVYQASKNPPRDRGRIKEFIKLVAPDEVSFQVSAVSIGLDADEAIDRADHYLGKIGL